MRSFSRILLIVLSCCWWGHNVVAQQEGLAFFVDGENLRRSGQHEKAIVEFSRALQKEPDNYKYMFAKAQSEYQVKRMEAALSSLNGTVKIKNDFVPAYVLMAMIHKAKGDFDKAAFNYDMAFNYEEDVAKKVSYKIFVMNKYVRENNLSVALDKVKEALSVSPDNENVILYYAKLSNKLEKYPDVISGIARIESKIKNMSAEQKAKFYYELGYAHYHMEEYDKAKEAWKFADFGPYKAKLEKFSPKYFCNLSLGYLKFYENDISKQYADHAIKIDKDFPTSYVLLAQLSKRNNDQTATIQNLENAIKSATDPQRKLPLLVQLTEIQLSGKDYDNALTNVNAALELRPEEPKAVMLKAIVLYHKGANKECMDFVQKALTQRYDAATIAELNFVLGLAAKKANNTQVAKQAFLVASRSSLRDVAEAELRAMKELKVLEDEAELN